MITINNDSIVLGASELRTLMPQITKSLKIKTVIVTKKGKPVAVLEDFDEYQQKNRLLETFEDIVLGYLARERDKKSKQRDFVNEQEVAKRFNVSL